MPVWCKVFWEAGNAIRRVWLTGQQTNGEIWIKKCWFLTRASSWGILPFWTWHSMAEPPQQPLQNETFLQRLKSAGKWSSSRSFPQMTSTRLFPVPSVSSSTLISSDRQTPANLWQTLARLLQRSEVCGMHGSQMVADNGLLNAC